MNTEQLLQQIQLAVETCGLTETARALQVPVSKLKKLLAGGEIPAEVMSRATEIGLVEGPQEASNA